MKCSRCNTENPAGQLYCGHCGARLAIGEGPEEAYYSATFWGLTTTMNRTYYWAYYGLLMAASAVASLPAFIGYILAGDPIFFVLGVGVILLVPVVYLVAVYRLRVYRRQMRKT